MLKFASAIGLLTALELATLSSDEPAQLAVVDQMKQFAKHRPARK